MNMNDASKTPKPIVGEEPDQKDGNQFAGKKSRLKALMHRASREEQECEVSEIPAKKAKAGSSRKEVKAVKARRTSAKKSTDKATVALQQQQLIASLRQDNNDLRDKLEATLNENRQLKQLLEQQQEIAVLRSQALQGMVQKFQTFQRQQQQQRPQQQQDTASRLLPHLSDLASVGLSSRDSSARSSFEGGSRSRQEATSRRNDNVTSRELQQQLERVQESILARNQTTNSDNNLSHEAVLAAARARRGDSFQLNASAQARITQRLNEIQELQVELQRLTQKLEKR